MDETLRVIKKTAFFPLLLTAVWILFSAITLTAEQGSYFLLPEEIAGSYFPVSEEYMIPQDEIQPRSTFVVPIDFLGQRTWLQTGGLRLAKRLNAQVVTVFSTQDDGNENKRRLIVEPFELPTSGLKPPELQHDLQMCMRRFEVQVLAHPYLWWDLKRDDLVERLTAIPKTNQIA